jgi:hypothetical protein
MMKCRGRYHDEREKTLTLKIGYIYYIMNITCIDMITLELNIYMCRGWRIYKKSLLKEYNGIKDYHTSN